ncbi:MAG: hypothetical protein IPG47_10635 [Thermoflexaceae bacterium]|jgi:ElaB/YqjD/DUF883 family membrane-anchored ribosome-binding protein|nr:hypothetical protein [Thermoflexaceae bacterium]
MQSEEFGTRSGSTGYGDLSSGAASRGSSAVGADGGSSMMEQAGDVASKAQEAVSSKAEQVKEQAGEMRSQAGEKIVAGADAGKERAASGLSVAAERMRERADSHEGMQADVATKAADAMDRTASYLKEHDSQELWSEVEAFVKEHPMQAAAGALFAGYMLGKIIR